MSGLLLAARFKPDDAGKSDGGNYVRVFAATMR